MDIAPLYYRLLHSPAHIRDWQGGHFYSYHYTVPGEWIEAYYKKTLRDPDAFRLDLHSGRHTEAAKNAFLELAENYRHGALWNEQDRKRVSQLDGVCAFSDLGSLHHYAQGTPYGGMFVVEFEGTYVSKIPESQLGSSGVLVKPTKAVSMKTYQAP